MFEQITVTDAAVKTLDQDVYKGRGTRQMANGALITIENADVRVIVGSRSPTTTIGVLFEVGGAIDLTANELDNFKVICSAGTAILNVNYK